VAGKSAILTVKILSDAEKATAGFDKAAAGIAGVGTAADTASAKMKSASGSMSSVADSADDMEGKAAKATGALGAMSSGFELIGATGAAAALNQAAMATDFVSGAMDSFTLLTELNTVAKVKNKAATIASTIATKAQAVATKAAAVAQRAFNIAMALNPIGLIIAAVVLLVAGFVLLYKKSDTFRALVDRVGEIGKKAFDAIAKAAGVVVDKVTDIVKWIGKFLFPAGFETTVDAVKEAFSKMAGFIEDAVGWIAKISFPSPPKWMTDLIPGGNSATPGAAPALATGRSLTPGTTSTGGPSIVINVNGALDPESVARQIRRLLSASDHRTGGPPRGLSSIVRTT
jgi:hypothetical protein